MRGLRQIRSLYHPSIPYLKSSTHEAPACVFFIVKMYSCIAWSALAPRLNIPAARHVDTRSPSLGASGAINAVVAWYICRFPTNMLYFYG